MGPGPKGGGMKSKELEPRYSGDHSRAFWRRVNALPEKHSLYLCGVMLQEMEGRVLRWLQQAETEAKLGE